jgi:hypothetical protein
MATSFNVLILLQLVVVVVMTTMVTQSHFSAPVCWKTFTYPRLSVELHSVRGKEIHPVR